MTYHPDEATMVRSLAEREGARASKFRTVLNMDANTLRFEASNHGLRQEDFPNIVELATAIADRAYPDAYSKESVGTFPGHLPRTTDLGQPQFVTQHNFKDGCCDRPADEHAGVHRDQLRAWDRVPPQQTDREGFIVAEPARGLERYRDMIDFPAEQLAPTDKEAAEEIGAAHVSEFGDAERVFAAYRDHEGTVVKVPIAEVLTLRGFEDDFSRRAPVQVLALPAIWMFTEFVQHQVAKIYEVALSGEPERVIDTLNALVKDEAWAESVDDLYNQFASGRIDNPEIREIDDDNLVFVDKAPIEPQPEPAPFAHKEYTLVTEDYRQNPHLYPKTGDSLADPPTEIIPTVPAVDENFSFLPPPDPHNPEQTAS